MNYLRFALPLLILTGLNYVAAQDSSAVKSDYLPDIDAVLKVKTEYDLDNSLVRFEVRNARFGLKGKINEFMSYKIELDLSDEGKMKMLDAYVRLTPLKNLDIYMGQRKIPFSTDYMRNPAENIFANRSFLAKYINDGMRDIGFYLDYKFGNSVPVDILLGAVNGTGNNNPQWIERPNLVSRVVFGRETGFRATGNLYYGEAENKDNLALYGGELRYNNGNFLIESEYISRNWTDSIPIHDDGLYVHSYYNVILTDKIVKIITPTVRWDYMGDLLCSGRIDASRMTLGVNIGFEPKQFYSEIRLNYENYFKSSIPIHTDKLTLEFIARF
ncbi:MAG TPA: porin [Bacteroidales bacterium]|nr:porin [Bacteroidales bacterium]